MFDQIRLAFKKPLAMVTFQGQKMLLCHISSCCFCTLEKLPK